MHACSRPVRVCLTLALSFVVVFACLALLTGAVARATDYYDISGLVYDNYMPGNFPPPVGTVTVTVYDLTNTSAPPQTATVTGQHWGTSVTSDTDSYEAVATDPYYQTSGSAPFTAPYGGGEISMTPLRGNVSGTVSDHATGWALTGGPWVWVEGDGDGRDDDAFGSTDSSGHYDISLPDDQQYTVLAGGTIPEFGASGYAPIADYNVTVSAGVTDTLNFPLSPGEAEIAGTVSLNSLPAGNIKVFAYDNSGDSYSTYSGSNGEYTLRVPGSGPYNVDFVAGDNVHVYQLFNGLAGGTQVPSAALEVHTANGDADTGVNASLTVGGSITGRVTDTAGDAVSGATVEVQELDGSDIAIPGDTGASISSSTNSSGAYSVGGLPAGTYAVYVVSPTGALLSEYYGATTTVAAATPVSVALGSATPNIDVQLTPSASISGTVSASGGGPLSGVEVDLYGPSGTQLATTTTTSSGGYSFGSLAAGTYYLHFVQAPPYVSVWLGGSYTKTGSTAVALATGAAKTANQALVEGTYVTGTVTSAATGAAVSADTVSVYDANGDSLYSTSTGVSGAYQLGPLLPGSYRVKFAGLGELAAQFYNDAASLAGATPVGVTGSGNTTGIDAALTQGGGISGVVTAAATAAPLAGITVRLLDSSGNVDASTVTGADGSYSFSALTATSFYVEFVGGQATGSSIDYETEYYGGSPTLSASQPVRVSAGQVSANVDAALPEATTPGVAPAATNTTAQNATAKPTAPTISKVKLAGIAKNRTTISFELSEGKNGAPELASFRLQLPSGLSFNARELKRKLSLTKGDRFTYKLVKHVLEVTLKKRQKRFAVDIKVGAITATKAQVAAAKKKRLHPAKLKVSVYDVRKHRTALTYTIKNPH